MILKIDPIHRHIYLEGPVNAGEFLDAFYFLIGQDIEEEFEWTIIPSNELSLIYQS